MSSPIELFDKPRLAVDLPIAFGDVQLNPAQELSRPRPQSDRHADVPLGVNTGTTASSRARPGRSVGRRAEPLTNMGVGFGRRPIYVRHVAIGAGAQILFREPSPSLVLTSRPEIAGQASGEALASLVDLHQLLPAVMAATHATTRLMTK